jgi:hypothetical protein
MVFDYDELNPANDSFIADFPANERAQRLAVLSSISVDHDPEGLGEHTKVSLQRTADNPTLSSDAGFLYAKLVDAKTELFWKNDAADIVQLTDEDSASPDKVAVGGDTMTGDLIMDDADILMEGTSIVKILNANYLQARNTADDAWRALVGIDAADVCRLGDANLDTEVRVYVTDVDGLLVTYDAADKIVWNKGHFANIPLFTQLWESTGNAFTWSGSGTRTTVPHAVGALPKLWAAFLVCTSAQEGYVAGDELQINSGWVGGTPAGITVAVNDTNFYYHVSDTIGNIMKTNGASVNIDDGKWDITLRAWY